MQSENITMKRKALFQLLGYLLILTLNVYPQERNSLFPDPKFYNNEKVGIHQDVYVDSYIIRQKEILRETWNGDSWVSDELYLYGYDNENQLEYRVQKWDGTGWVDTLLVVYEYENDWNTSTSYYYWNGAQWLNINRYIYSYDSYGYTMSSLFQNGDSLEWTNNSLSTNYRSEQTHLIDSLLYQVWDVNGWKDYLKEIRFYNTLQKDSLWINYILSGDEWQNFGMYAFDYEAWPNYTMTYLKWTGTAWDNFYRYLYFYNDRGNYTGTTYQNWIEDSWKNSLRYLYEYDQNNNNTYIWYQLYILPYGWTIISESDFEYDENNLKVQRIDKSWHDDVSTDSLRWTYFYDSVEVTSQDKYTFENYSLIVSPNPATNNVRISFSLPSASSIDISIFNIHGKCVLQFFNEKINTCNHTFDFSTENLDPGVYLCRIISGSVIETRKLIIE